MCSDEIKAAYALGFKTAADKLAQKGPDSAYTGYPGQNINMQHFVPFSGPREFSPDEQAEIDAGKQKWFRGPFASRSDSMARKMADPKKRAVMAFILSTLGGTALGAHFLPAGPRGRGDLDGVAAGALAGAVAGVPIAALTHAFADKENRDIEGDMRRLPRDMTTLRDLESDPAWQARAERNAALRRAAMLANAVGGYRRHFV